MLAVASHGVKGLEVNIIREGGSSLAPPPGAILESHQVVFFFFFLFFCAACVTRTAAVLTVIEESSTGEITSSTLFASLFQASFQMKGLHPGIIINLTSSEKPGSWRKEQKRKVVCHKLYSP